MTINLTDNLITTIKKCTAQVFGETSTVFLYGYSENSESRPDGLGLLIEYDIEIDCMLDKKIDLITTIDQALQIHKVDVLTNRRGNEDHRLIVQEAYRMGKPL